MAPAPCSTQTAARSCCTRQPTISEPIQAAAAARASRAASSCATEGGHLAHHALDASRERLLAARSPHTSHSPRIPLMPVLLLLTRRTAVALALILSPAARGVAQ